MDCLVALVRAMPLGFLAGPLSFEVTSRWCAACGAVTSCPRSAGWAGHWLRLFRDNVLVAR